MTLKQDRMAERIRHILSELFLREISDPRLTGLTVTEVKLDPELMFADIYVNALGDESREKEVMAGLGSATGFLRREVGKRVRLRRIPELHFHWDASIERSEQIQRILNNLDIPPAEEEIYDDE